MLKMVNFYLNLGLIKGSYWFADQKIIRKWVDLVLKKD